MNAVARSSSKIATNSGARRLDVEHRDSIGEATEAIHQERLRDDLENEITTSSTIW
jgi:hypothetical protein